MGDPDPWRRTKRMSEEPKCPKPRREDYERALQSMDTFIDIGVTDLMDLTERAQHFANQRTAESLLVSRIMSQPLRVIHPEATMAEAAHLMIKERISGLPVVDDDGVIT